MHRTLTALRAVATFTDDVLKGSVLLAHRMWDGSSRLYRRARTLTATAPKPGPGSKDAKTEDEKTAPTGGPEAAGSAGGEPEAPVKKPGKDRRHASGTKPAGGKPKAWTLDRLAGFALAGWAAWCFLHRPVANGWHAIAPDLAGLAPWGALWWITAAWLTAQYAKRQATADAPQSGNGAPDETAVRLGAYWLWHLVCTSVAEAVAKGRKGVHLKTLLEEPGIPETWTVTTLREHCDRLGIPVKMMQIRGNGGPTHGVHIDELTTALGMPLDDAVTLLAAGTQTLLPNPPQDTLPALAVEAPPGTAEEAPADPDLHPGKRWTVEELLRLHFDRAASPTGTTGSTPLPDPSPASPGRG